MQISPKKNCTEVHFLCRSAGLCSHKGRCYATKKGIASAIFFLRKKGPQRNMQMLWWGERRHALLVRDYPGSPTQAKPKAACGGEKPRPRCAFMTPSVICSAECRRRFVQLPRGFTVLSPYLSRTFSVHYVRIGFGQRLSEPPCIDHAWSISLRFPLFSYIYENQSRGPHRNQRGHPHALCLPVV